jgi:hypothetical protein
MTNSQKVKCDCGKEVRASNLPRHQKTKRCIKICNEQKQDQELKSTPIYAREKNISDMKLIVAIDEFKYMYQFKSQGRFKAPHRFYEFIDVNMVYTMLENPTKYNLVGKDRDGVRARLNKMLKKSRQGELQVSYVASKDSPQGRVFAVGGSSLQPLAKEYRHSLARDYYYDVDICNCHPVMAYHVFKAEGIECPNLKYYIDNRDECIKKTIDLNLNTNPTTRDAVKQTYLEILNGGTRGFQQLILKSHNLSLYKFEIESNVKILKSKYPDMWTRINEKVEEYNSKSQIKKIPEGVFFNRFLCRKERIVMKRIMEFLYRTGVDPSRCVDCFDGWLIPKQSNEFVPTDKWLRHCEDFVKGKTGVEFKLALKPMDKGFPVPQHMEQYNEHLPFDIKDPIDWREFVSEYNGQTFNTMTECVDTVIEDFNRVGGVIIDGSRSYVIKTDQTEYKFLTNKSFQSGQVKFNIVGEKRPVTLTEILNNNITLVNNYKGVVFDPSKSPYDTDYFNNWRGYKAEYLGAGTHDYSSLEPIHFHIKQVLCDGNPLLIEHFYKWIQLLLVRPEKKPSQAVFLYSRKQGSGKNIVLDNFFRPYIIGEESYQNVNGLDELVEKHDTRKAKKKLVFVDEVSSNAGSFLSTHDKLKSMITSDRQTINPKGGLIHTVKDLKAFVFSSNHTSFRVEESGRRFICCKVSEAYVGNQQYFNLLSDTFNQTNGDLFYTQMINAYNENPFNRLPPVPRTELLESLCNQSLGSEARFIKGLKEGDIRMDDDTIDELLENQEEKQDEKRTEQKITPKDLYREYSIWCKDTNNRIKPYQKFNQYSKENLPYKRISSKYYFILPGSL